ncbi:DUF805 domain-containing protein [Microbacterium trichothecenolyticum]|uniref:Uncharacterized membrane protein YhaH (DUF805 family) n=1 Tax=Microbacterium trichothecenolyticum TaxID=69370 RepID=A0ABU0TYH9_MICTR|nr:DUF805 domain-containing protein [Microbacterium trichothecenolyticum]MDQ1124720.1 uncharacterized membrane protein YhaH (DUF805 family) [Microbacterium trichothecenolyticum]
MTISPPEPALDQPYEGAPWGVAHRRLWKKGFTFTGRASRSEFWRAWALTTGVVLALYLGSILVSVAGTSAAMSAGNYSAFTTVTVIAGLLLLVAALYALAIVIPVIALTIRRLHDIDKSGAYYLVTFIPFIGGLLLLGMLAQPARPEGARFDLPSSTPTSGAPAAPTVSTYGEIAAPPASTASASAVPVPPPAPAAGPLAVPVPPPAPVTVLPAVAVPPPAFAPVVPSTPPAPTSPAAAAGTMPSAPSPISGIPISGIPGMPSSLASPPAAVEGDLDSTRIVAPRDTSGWTLELPDGRRLAVDGAVSLGRDPVSEHGGILVPIDDPARSMSKTHARFDLTAAGITVTDLHSTNGTRIDGGSAPSVSVAPGVATAVPEGATVVLGEYAVRLQRR